ncbi:MAG: DUF2569 family protein, partial [Flavobacteriales bacterium]|nr:DUF2569 family protein [Flavobacteriales bacterium]
YKSWSSVIDMFNKHYSLDEDSRIKLKSQFSRLLSISDTDSFIVASTRFVQDEIRYLGFEDGSNSYKPEPPMKVLSQRYGDCKAKSFLLCEVLRSNGIKAWPMLVHSYKGLSLEDHLPSPSLFDHCVVQISKGYEDYYIDPTISNQGGDLDHLYFPNYHFGLVLNPEEKGLRSLPDANHSNSVTTETFDLEPVGGGASLRVSSVYFGGDADYQRGMFAGSSLSTIQRDFVNFYSTLYPSIEVSRDIMIIDNRNGVNQFIVEESYWIDTLWEKSLDEKDLIYVEFYPLSLKNNLVVTQSPVRTMPYYVKYPLDVTHNTVVMLPESWNVTTESNTIRSDAFVYNYSVKYSGNDITIMHNYKTYTGHISAAAVENYIASHDEILGGLTYMISYTSIVEEDFELSWLAVFIALLTFCTGVYYAIKIYTNYDIPVAVAPTYGKSIGGWLILVAIGLTLSPIRLIIDLYNLPEYFDSSVWRALLNFDASIRYLFTAILMFIEMIYNFLYIPFLFLVLFLFYNRRSILPRFAIILYATTFGFLLIDTVAALSLNPEAYSDAETYETFKDVGRSFIAAIIWVPYFMYSERVQRTFVMKSSKNRKLDGEVTGVNVPPSIF